MARTVIIKNNLIEYENQTVPFTSLYTDGFYGYLNEVVRKFNYGTIIDNVIFLYFVRPMLSFVYYFEINKIEYVKIERMSARDKQIIAAAAFYAGIPCNVKKKKLSAAGHIKNRISILLTTCYLLFVSLLEQYAPDIKCSGCNLWIMRSDADRQKAYDREGTVILEETKIGRGSLYQNIKKRYRWRNILKSFKRANQEYCLVKSFLDETELKGLGVLILQFFAKRLPHIFYWGYSLESLIESGIVGRSVISGNFCDGYAEVEQRVSRRCKRTLIILPHGLEDGFLFPNGYTGDIFYTMTEYAADYLRRLYQTNKFIYDETVINNMLRKRNIGQAKKFVFFTDGTGNKLDIDLITHLSGRLEQFKQKLFIKLHPYEKKEKYKKIANIEYIWNIDEAICGNVCFSRGSTILVEAVYNDSVSVQVLIGDDNLKCQNIIPSLEDEQITHIFDYEELDAFILREIVEERKK